MNRFNERSIDFGINEDQIFGGSIPLDTENFNGLLSITENDVQKAIDKLDNITKSDIGLGNVDNTSDANKPVSSATQTALNAKVTGTLVTTVATPGTDTNIPSEQAVREAITSAVSGSSVPSWYHPFLFLGS